MVTVENEKLQEFLRGYLAQPELAGPMVIFSSKSVITLENVKSVLKSMGISCQEVYFLLDGNENMIPCIDVALMNSFTARRGAMDIGISICFFKEHGIPVIVCATMRNALDSFVSAYEGMICPVILMPRKISDFFRTINEEDCYGSY